MAKNFTPVSLYRLPWNLTDNAISWLEPTSACNLYCDGCYRENRKNSHKSLREIEQELDVFLANRRTDSISIAGGDPLMHPDIVEIVAMIHRRGIKPTLNTNGELLTKELLLELKKAGCYGFTLHIDSGQKRKHWTGKNEIELNELRYKYAKMIKDAGGMSCALNMTVYPENMHYVSEIMDWGHKNMDLVHVMVFIIYRIAAIGKDLEYYVGDKKVSFEEITYSTNDSTRRSDITSPEMVEIIKEKYPDFAPAAYLNGTHDPDSYKWLLAGRMGNKEEIFGYIGPKFMELVQTVKHLFTGKYLAYSEPAMQRRGRMYFPMAVADKGLRNIMMNYIKSFARNPLGFFRRLHYQSILIIQPIDILDNNELNMCDGCPDMTVWNGKMVWSCRMEEQYQFGTNVKVVKKSNEE